MLAVVALNSTGEGAHHPRAVRANPRAFHLPADALEMLGARRERGTRFRLADGLSFADVIAGRPLYYRDAGGWQPVASGLVSRGGDLVAEALPFAVRATAEGLALGARDGEGGLLLLTEGRPRPRGAMLRGRPRGGRLLWDWELSGGELKLTSARVSAPRGMRTYAFPFRLWGGFAPLVVEAQGRLTNGALVFGRPFVQGNDGVAYEVAAWEAAPGSSAFVLRVDDRSLPASAYPYRIDPAIGPYAATTAANFTRPPFHTGTAAWNDPQRALTNNNAKAKVVDLAPDAVTHGLYLSGFGFDVAPLAVVTGVEVTLDRSTGGCGGCVPSGDCLTEDQLYLSVDGLNVAGTNRAGTACWPLSSTQPTTFGGPTDTWGTALTPGQVNAAAFGPIVSARGVSAHGSNLPDAEVDFVAITVYWRQPDPPPGTLLAVADTFVRGLENTNQGLETFLRVREEEDNRALIRFDQAALGAAVGAGSIARATLELYIEFNAANWGAGRTVDIHRLTRDWTELGATWNCPDDGNTVNQEPDCGQPWAGGSYAAVPTDTVVHTNGQVNQWVQFDVTADVAAFLAGTAPNYGWLIKKTEEQLNGRVEYTAREGRAGFAPRLVLQVGSGSTATPPCTPTRTATQSATRTSIATRTASASATPTRTPTATLSHTPTATETATVTQLPTPTHTPSAVPADTVAPAATPTDTETFTARPTTTFTDTASPTPTATATPVPPGLVVGKVFDDGTAQPLGGVSRAGVGSQVSGLGDPQGRYALSLPAGQQVIELAMAGYTRSARAVTVPAAGAVQARDARLTALAAPVIVGIQGGVVEASLPTPDSGLPSERLTLTIPPNALAEDTAIRLTPLSPQGLVAPVPLGWSVLLGVDIQSESTGDGSQATSEGSPSPSPVSTPANGEGSARALLRIPLSLLPIDSSVPLTAAVWDHENARWLGGPAATATGDAVEMALGQNGSPDSRLPTPVFQLSLLVADSVPTAPPPASEGQPLEGVAAAEVFGASASVTTVPPLILSGTGAGADVLASIHSANPLPSGTVFEARVRESYELRDGGRVLGITLRQDLAAYQISPLTPSSEAYRGVGAAFTVVPSRTFGFRELIQGRVAIDIAPPEAVEEFGLIDVGGGEVTGPGGLRLIVPRNAAAGPTVLALSAVAPASLPVLSTSGPAFLGAVQIDASGGALDPLAAYGLGLGGVLPEGQRFILGRLAISDQRSALVLAALGHSANGVVTFDACPDGLGFCLEGFRGSGVYAVFAVSADVALVTGTVGDGPGPRPGIPVESSQLPVVSIADSAARYALPAPIGVTSILTAHDRANDLSGEASVTPSTGAPAHGLTGILTADITLTPASPEVTGIDPPNHASNVPTDVVITVTFSEPVAPSSLTDASVQLTILPRCVKGGSGGISAEPVAARRSLSADGKVLTLTPTTAVVADALYRLTLTNAITDLSGHALTRTPTDALTGSPLLPGESEGEVMQIAFSSDFTTAALFTADALPPNTLRLSLPDEQGRVFVCGGPQLAVPGTFVDVINETTGEIVAGLSTDLDGQSASDVCDVLFPGRCDTSQPGSFCVAIDAALGDRIQVQVEDVFQNLITLEAGHMRDERTGSTAVGPEGGRVTAVEDPRYGADIPAGAFDQTRVVTVFPVRDEDVPVPLGEESGLQRLGALFLDLGDEDAVAGAEIDLTIPAPPGLGSDAQVLVGHVIDFRGFPELTMVDTASRFTDENGEEMLSTDSPPFPGPTRGGYYDFSTPNRAVGYVTGAVDKQHATMNVLPTALTYVFPFLVPDLVKFAMPVIADEPFIVSLVDVQGAIVDRIDIQGPPRGEFLDLSRPLTDDQTPPGIDGISIADGQTDVASDAELVLTFRRPVDTPPDGRLPRGAIDVRDQDRQLIDGVWVVVSADGRRVRFFPTRPFPPAATLTVEVVDVRDRSGARFPSYVSAFSTFAPRLVASVPIPANDVDVLQHVENGAVRPYALVAHDGDESNDSFGGLVTIDVRNPLEPRVVSEVPTGGVDRAVRVASHEPPLVLSVDGAGHPQRFGTLRAFDLSNPAAPQEIGRRILNLSPQAISEQVFLSGIPAEGGVPRSIALIGRDAVYVANAPTIGIQAVTVSRMIPPQNEIEGVFRGTYRAVAALRQLVAAAGWGARGNEVIALDPSLSQILGQQPLGAAPIELIALPAYPVDLDGDGNLGLAEDGDDDPLTDADERMDLLLVLCDGHALWILRVSEEGELGEIGKLALPGMLGNPRGGVVDAQRRVLYLAAGTAGLAVVDFHDPFALIAADNPVLAAVPLSGQARQVRLLTDAGGVEYALVAGDRALDIVQVTPAEAGLTIYDTNNSAIIPERFEEDDGSFILANNDNDDASTDALGRPILDRDDGGHVEGENDLRRLDIRAPMTGGVLTLDLESGSMQVRLWRTAERDGLFSLPQQYDLSAGERPPETVWIEGVAPSEADRDVQVRFHWEPPPDSGLDPFDDVVTATVVELDFIPGRHGGAESADNLLGDRKTTFLNTRGEQIEDILAGRAALDALSQAQFGRLRIRGIGLDSIAEVTARSADETAPRRPRRLDETDPGDVHLQALGGPRTSVSDEDVIVYTGAVTVGEAALSPRQVRAALKPEALPLHAEAETLAETAVEQSIVIQSAIGLHPPLIGGGAGPAALEIIDAQAFAESISAGVRGDDLYEEYLAYDWSRAPHRSQMDGALADRWSRLIVRLVLPASDPHTSFDFHLETDPPEEQALLGSNHIGDEAFPFGMLSLTGFEGFNANEDFPERITSDGPSLDLTNIKVRKRGRRRAVAATFTPPGSFPYKATGEGAGLTQKLKLSIAPTGGGDLATRKLLLVRPPVLFVHGLTGSREAFGSAFVDEFRAAFVPVFADYAAQSVSGFDRIFRAVPREIDVELSRLRMGNHQADPVVPRRGELGLHVSDLRDKKIAATKVDVVAHSMGGLATRWFATDALAERPSQGRFIHYPASRGLSPPTIPGTGFPRISTVRLGSERFKRTANFMRGSIRKVVTTGSPQLGSPVANFVTHDVCEDDRACYTGVLGNLVGWLAEFAGQLPEDARGASDFGTAVYDLSQGSLALGLLQEVPSEPVPVHAIAATKPAAQTEFDFFYRYVAKFLAHPSLLLLQGDELQEALEETPDPTWYCPDFSAATSDLIVPVASALYGATHNTIVKRLSHLEVNTTADVALEIADRLLQDNPIEREGVNDFEARFAPGQPWPLTCQ